MNQAIEKYISSKDDEEQLLVLYQLFKTYDLDGNNSIDRKEIIPFFMDFLKEIGMDPNSITSDDVKKFMGGIDADGNGSISFVEFENWFKEAILAVIPSTTNKKKKKKKKKTLLDEYLSEKDTNKQVSILRSIFEKYDSNLDGKIDSEEFTKFLSDLFKQFELGVPSDEHVIYFFAAIDTDHSGGITINEIDVWLRENINKFTQP